MVFQIRHLRIVTKTSELVNLPVRCLQQTCKGRCRSNKCTTSKKFPRKHIEHSCKKYLCLAFVMSFFLNSGILLFTVFYVGIWDNAKKTTLKVIIMNIFYSIAWNLLFISKHISGIPICARTNYSARYIIKL